MQKFLIAFLFVVFSLLNVFGQKQSSNNSKDKSQNKSITQTQIPKGWKLVDLDGFSFILPESMEDKKARGKDSEIWIFESNEMKLVIDSGRYETTFPDAEDFKNLTKQVVVDNVKGQYFAIDYTNPKSSQAKIDEKDKQKPYFNAIVFKRNKYLFSSFYIRYKNPNEKKTASKILYSIKFKQR